MFSLFEQNTRPDSKTNWRTFKILGCNAPSWPSSLTTSIQQNYCGVGIFYTIFGLVRKHLTSMRVRPVGLDDSL